MRYNQSQLNFLKEFYPQLQLPDLAIKFNAKFKTSKTAGQLRSTCKNHKITSGRKTIFKKGQKPWNTGTKGKSSSNSHSFKPGNKPANLKPIGHERICKQNGYVLIKVNEPNPYTPAKTRYRPKHIIIWEQTNGPIPKNHILKFIDCDPQNWEIENLMLLTKRQFLHLNQLNYQNVEPEFRETLLLLAKVKTKRFEITNKG